MYPNFSATPDRNVLTWKFIATAVGAPCKLTGTVTRRRSKRPSGVTKVTSWTATCDQFPEVSARSSTQLGAVYYAARKATGIEHS